MNEVESYIRQYPEPVQDILVKIRELILTIAPEANEQLSYGMPAYKLNGQPFVYFAAYKHHIGFYATPNTHESFQSVLSKYKQGKGSVQFPLRQVIPFDIIEKMIQFRVNEIRSV